LVHVTFVCVIEETVGEAVPDLWEANTRG